MKFFIDDKEIKTVNKGATIKGCLSLVSRCANFSFIYNENDSNFEKYKAKINSDVTIENDEGKNIFKGFVSIINYNQNEKTVEIEALDYFSFLLNSKIAGRFSGGVLSALNKLLSGFNIYSSLIKNIKKELNVISFGSLSRYDILEILIKNMYEKEEFKLYLDGDNSINVLLPLRDNSKGDFKIGENIISAYFSQEGFENISRITAIGNDDVVSGTIIKIIDPKNNKSGYFTVKSDIHTYADFHIMDLELKERKLWYEKLGRRHIGCF